MSPWSAHAALVHSLHTWGEPTIQYLCGLGERGGGDQSLDPRTMDPSKSSATQHTAPQ